MWNAFGRVSESTDTFLYYEIATRIGQSGSPVIKRKGSHEKIIGVHIGWDEEKKKNAAVMLNTTKRKTLNNWLKEIFRKLKHGQFFA